MPAFNPLIEKLSPPPVPSVAAWGRAYDGSKGPLIDLSQAVPGYPAHPDMLKLLGEAGSSKAFTGYGPIEGEAELRTAYAAHVSEVYGANIGLKNIHITSGCNQAFVCAAMTVAGPGNTVLMTEPFYFNHETTLAMMGVKTAFVACEAANGFLPDLLGLEAAITGEVRALALVSPNNPTGAIYPPSLLEAIFKLCRTKSIWLILDETYRDFLPTADQAPHALFSLDGWEDTLISLYSFSKSFCIPGHRLGAITAGPVAVEQIAKIMDNLQICAPRAAQAAVAKALPLLADWREENRQEIGRRADALKAVMRSVNDWKLDAIGAYFAFVRHPFPGKSSAEVAEKLARQAGIICIPGAYFGESQQDYLRFAFANADVPTIGLLRERLQNFTLS
ncbi:aminotransferase [Neorhizobium galegae]|uniref:aminotransferase n=1 Tax=Neorhizobium galegae TaxID=399 RepID=UPI0006221D6B|nr:aminotransferase [Neorhizobium galegae]CDZ25846.1 Aminotransferase class I and II [Neorhizobium galegae bv. officinalis]KAA9388497.1 aminotransferase [Neorhizobium galegae]KAB1114776.1 aminotransferase [Neorhizobium galegae]MCM2497052.1 aminotransferase [Neorhizobium galegae]MCQ1771120.1 aminotransferase [Neorhizobium galegae]